jgi:hypothetical protein
MLPSHQVHRHAPQSVEALAQHRGAGLLVGCHVGCCAAVVVQLAAARGVKLDEVHHLAVSSSQSGTK